MSITKSGAGELPQKNLVKQNLLILLKQGTGLISYHKWLEMPWLMVEQSYKHLPDLFRELVVFRSKLETSGNYWELL